jgi:hypothetical protein
MMIYQIPTFFNFIDYWILPAVSTLIAFYLSSKLLGVGKIKYQKLIILSILSASTLIYLIHIAFGYPAPWEAPQWWDIVIVAILAGFIYLIYFKINKWHKEKLV